jgi:hypothetical protein
MDSKKNIIKAIPKLKTSDGKVIQPAMTVPLPPGVVLVPYTDDSLTTFDMVMDDDSLFSDESDDGLFGDRYDANDDYDDDDCKIC